MVDPRRNTSVARWELFVMFSLLFTAIITPYEVAFVEPVTDPLDPWFIVNRGVDLIFLLDCILHFFLVYPAPRSVLLGEAWVTNHRMILQHYATTWLCPDLLALLAGGYDIVNVCYNIEEHVKTAGAMRVVFRLLRASRLIKMLRLARYTELLKNLQSRYAINFSIFRISKTFIGVLVICHWLACVWGLQTTFYDSRIDTWMGDLGYCRHVASAGVQCVPALTLYAASLDWAVALTTSIGHSEITAGAGRASEQVLSALLMLFGGLFWASVIGEVCMVLANRNPDETIFQRTMDDLNRFMSLHNLSPTVKQRVREYFQQSGHVSITERQLRLLRAMSPALQAEVMWLVHKPWLQRVPFLRNAPKLFLAELAVSLEPKVYTPGESAQAGFLYAVQRGAVMYEGSILGAGHVWGIDIIMQREDLRSAARGRALGYVEVYCISRSNLLDIASRSPSVHKHIRWRAFRLAIRRFLAADATSTRASARLFDSALLSKSLGATAEARRSALGQRVLLKPLPVGTNAVRKVSMEHDGFHFSAGAAYGAEAADDASSSSVPPAGGGAGGGCSPGSTMANSSQLLARVSNQSVELATLRSQQQKFMEDVSVVVGTVHELQTQQQRIGEDTLAIRSSAQELRSQQQRLKEDVVVIQTSVQHLSQLHIDMHVQQQRVVDEVVGIKGAVEGLQHMVAEVLKVLKPADALNQAGRGT